MNVLAVRSNVSLRITAGKAYGGAIASTKVGEKLVFAVDESVGSPRIAVLNEARQIIGWLPSSDPLIQHLFDGRQYSAACEAKTRSGYIYLAVTTQSGSVDLPGSGEPPADSVADRP